MKYSFLWCTFLIVLFSCRNSSDVQKDGDDSATKNENSHFDIQQLAGVFYDTVACKNCAGLGMIIDIKPDYTYIAESRNGDKNITYQTGVWTLQDSLLQLEGTSPMLRFRVIDHATINLTDTAANLIKNDPNQNNFRRNNVPFKPVQPIPSEGMFSAVNDTMKIHFCRLNKEYPATLAPSAMIVTAKYKAVAKNGEAVYATFSGHFELRPSLKNNSTQDFFVIEKFNSFEPAKQCE